MKKKLRKIMAVLMLSASLLGVLSGCSLKPCEECGDTPTKAFLNKYYDEKEYYCKRHYSRCAFCSEKATEYYTSGLGTIVFVCKDCYQDILSLNS